MNEWPPQEDSSVPKKEGEPLSNDRQIESAQVINESIQQKERLEDDTARLKERVNNAADFTALYEEINNSIALINEISGREMSADGLINNVEDAIAAFKTSGVKDAEAVRSHPSYKTITSAGGIRKKVLEIFLTENK